MTIHLVRHAHAGKRSEWEGDDRKRPLSPRGEAQSASLVALLGGERVGRVLSSPYVRCVQTVEPLAQKLGVAVEADDRFAEGSDPDVALAALLELAEPGGVACSHGDLIPVLVRRLVADGMAVDGPLLDQKGSTWVLETTGGRITRGRYVPPAS